VKDAGVGAPGPPGAPVCPGLGPLGADPIPVAVELNGLLPGRGPGRGGPGTPVAGRPAEPPGRGEPPGAGRGAAGRGAPRVPVSRSSPTAGLPAPAPLAGASGCACGNGTGGLAGAGAWPASASAGGAAAAGASGAAAAGASGVAAAGVTEAGPRPLVPPRPSPSDGVAGALAAGALAAGAAWPSSVLPPRPCRGCWAANASLSLRTTGASIVEDADRTNSPISWSLAITALLSTPNSFASSYTRTFATALPLLDPA
jgi:hypothetical protein